MRMRMLTTWITCLTCFLAGLGGATGAVLCIGADGHLKLEAADHGCCCEATEADHADPIAVENAVAAHDDHCFDCVDLSIPVPRRKAARAQRTGCERVECCNQPARPATGLSDEPEARLVLRRPSVGDSTLDSLRTVIILS